MRRTCECVCVCVVGGWGGGGGGDTDCQSRYFSHTLSREHLRMQLGSDVIIEMRAFPPYTTEKEVNYIKFHKTQR